MHRADDIVVVAGGQIGEIILLDAATDGQPLPVLFAQRRDLAPVGGGPRRGHAVRFVAGRVAVAGEAQPRHAHGDGGLNDGLGAVFAVAERRMDVKVLADHEVIFSCFTLRSMTCREASSCMTSSSEIPAWIISTSTW